MSFCEFYLWHVYYSCCVTLSLAMFVGIFIIKKLSTVPVPHLVPSPDRATNIHVSECPQAGVSLVLTSFYTAKKASVSHEEKAVLVSSKS